MEFALGVLVERIERTEEAPVSRASVPRKSQRGPWFSKDSGEGQLVMRGTHVATPLSVTSSLGEADGSVLSNCPFINFML